jgi:membrane associated rhomboid family serine protease
MIPLKDNVPTRTFPIVTIGIIVVNSLVWFWELRGRGVDYHVVKDGYYPCSFEGPCEAVQIGGTVFRHHLSWWEGTFTSMFMHGSWEHIIGNMLFLWIFGNNVEDALGKIRFFVWYLLAGVAATALQTFVTLSFGTVRDASIPNIGASGAIAGVLGAYFLLLPRARVLTVIFFGLIFLREIPAVWFLGVWIALQIWQGGLGLTHPDQTGGVAVFAHIGGFAFGFLTVYLVAKRRPLRPTY